jgi:hypothetical protein
MRLRNVTMAVGTAALIAIAVPVQAQVWNDGGRRGAYGNDVRSIAYNNGYQEGLNHGEQAARDRHAYDMQREKDYRNADEGYRSEYGNKDLYRDEFRRGFAQGYQEAYARFDNRYGGNNGVWNGAPYPSNGRVYGGVATERGYGYGYGAGRNIAFRNGESDGYQKGLDDARDGKYPQPERPTAITTAAMVSRRTSTRTNTAEGSRKDTSRRTTCVGDRGSARMRD